MSQYKMYKSDGDIKLKKYTKRLTAATNTWKC